MYLNKSPWYILISCFVFLQIIQAVDSLQCYKCNDCNEEKHDLEQCDPSMYSCLKFTWKDEILKRCARKEICKTKNIAAVLPKFLGKISNIFSSSDGDLKDDGKDVLTCCDSDYCNSSNFAMDWLGLWGLLGLSWITMHLQ